MRYPRAGWELLSVSFLYWLTTVIYSLKKAKKIRIIVAANYTVICISEHQLTQKHQRIYRFYLLNTEHSSRFVVSLLLTPSNLVFPLYLFSVHAFMPPLTLLAYKFRAAQTQQYKYFQLFYYLKKILFIDLIHSLPLKQHTVYHGAATSFYLTQATSRPNFGSGSFCNTIHRL